MLCVAYVACLCCVYSFNNTHVWLQDLGNCGKEQLKGYCLATCGACAPSSTKVKKQPCDSNLPKGSTHAGCAQGLEPWRDVGALAISQQLKRLESHSISIGRLPCSRRAAALQCGHAVLAVGSSRCQHYWSVWTLPTIALTLAHSRHQDRCQPLPTAPQTNVSF